MSKMVLDLGRCPRLTRDPYPVSTNVRSCRVTCTFHFPGSVQSIVILVRDQ